MYVSSCTTLTGTLPIYTTLDENIIKHFTKKYKHSYPVNIQSHMVALNTAINNVGRYAHNNSKGGLELVVLKKINTFKILVE